MTVCCTFQNYHDNPLHFHGICLIDKRRQYCCLVSPGNEDSLDGKLNQLKIEQNTKTNLPPIPTFT